jgi:serine/threonine protein kinase/tetratricopeptide (TPR) repeat protein
MATQCPRCNTENPDDSKYCRECASPLQPSTNASVTKTLKTPARGFSKGSMISGKYRIIQKLGEGGMGIVYKAKDTKLDRIVALKFLSVELTGDEEAKNRFVQEAKAAAALNHAHICTIYEVDEARNRMFIAMEFIKGKSLKEKLEEGALGIDQALAIAIQVAVGLRDAHEKGIIHRDIKPANIMLTEKGQAKITDFGLAKLSGGADLTKTSTIMGTVAYMSPEQAKGEDVDHRTDIWSLGATLFEMLTGERPFTKSHEQALIYSISHEEPKSLISLRPHITEQLQNVVHKTLEKEIDGRYQTIEELIQDLKRSPLKPSPKEEKSIVVLPFENLSPDPDQEFFSDGLTEEIITDLSKIETLRVISRTSAMRLKGTHEDITSIGKKLNIHYALEGSVRKAGNNLRITAQLIDTRTDAHLWAEKYRGTLDDVFDIQEKVSRSIVNSLQLKLSPKENQEMERRPIDNVYAYECYLKANHEIYRFSKESLDRAVRLIQNGLDIVGENELLYEAMGNAHVQYVNFAVSSDESFLKVAEDWVKKLLDLNPNSSLGYSLDGLIRWKRGDWQVGFRHLQKSLALDPNNPRPREYLVYLSSIAGKGHYSRALLPKLLEIDPLTPLFQCFGGWIEYMEGNFEDALAAMPKMFKMEPENVFYGIIYVHFLTRFQPVEKIDPIIDMLVKAAPQNYFAQLGLFRKLALHGKKKEALKTVTPELKGWVRWDEQFSWEMAASYALIDQKQEALDWLENAVDRGFINYPFLNEYDPLLENIRNEDRFRKLMKRVKNEWESFEV